MTDSLPPFACLPQPLTHINLIDPIKIEVDDKIIIIIKLY